MIIYHSISIFTLAFMMAWPYAFVQIMSSYAFDKMIDWTGPPSDGPNTKDVLINAYFYYYNYLNRFFY